VIGRNTYKLLSLKYQWDTWSVEMYFILVFMGKKYEEPLFFAKKWGFISAKPENFSVFVEKRKERIRYQSPGYQIQ